MSREVVTIKQLQEEIERVRKSIRDRQRRIDNCEVDDTDCFLSARADSDHIDRCKRQIEILKNFGCAWFVEYATLDNVLVEARWVQTKYGTKLVVDMPNCETVWTSARTAKGLARNGLKMVRCLRPAWAKTDFAGCTYTRTYPAKFNRATGEEASEEPIQVDWDFIPE